MRLHEAPPARGLVPTLTLATFVNHLNVIAWNPFLPFIAAELGVAVTLLGQVPALMMLLATSLGLVIGPLADHYGYRRTLLVCLLAVVTSSLATGLAATLPILVLAALVGAGGRAAIMPVAQAIVTSSFVDDTARRHAVSRTQSGGPLAATVGIPLLMASAAALQWRGAFLVLSGLALVTALLLWKLLCRDEAPGRGQVRLSSILAVYRPLVRHRASLTVIVAACLEHAGVWAMWTYYGAFYMQQHAFSTQQVGWGAARRPSRTPLSRRVRRRRAAHRPVADAPAARTRGRRPDGGRVADAWPGHGQHRRPAGRAVARRAGSHWHGLAMSLSACVPWPCR